MNKNKTDVIFIEADSSRAAYQDLAEDFAAIETPTWSLLLAQSCIAKGFLPMIVDQKAERMSDEQIVDLITREAPNLVVFVVYGQNPNSSTTNMVGATRISSMLDGIPIQVAFIGTHVSALPKATMFKHPEIDYILLGDGVYALHNLLELLNTLPKFAVYPSPKNVEKVKGIVYRDSGGVLMTPPERPVPQDRMDEDLPGYAWDLIPPLSRYRAHVWHPKFDESKRSPFAAVYTSLGCPMKCQFCTINTVNRSSMEDRTYGGMFNTMRFWSPKHMLNILEDLQGRGVETLRISDEMFYLNRKYYEPLLKGIIDRELKFDMWSYTRIDTVNEKFLDLFKSAGVNWLCAGIEAGNNEVRKDVTKGKYTDVDVRNVVTRCENHGIEVLANFIVGLPEDTHETMQETLDLALELNTAHMNVYACQAIPGSELHWIAKDSGWALPETYEGYAFLSYECLPLRTKHLTAAEVLAFRDKFWQTYFSGEKYLTSIEKKFGKPQRKNVEKMARIKLKRKLLGD
jgi:anaerobic magnesium-protoporphyrin IX monomethyl ester cyclase